jgi:hypothetical protein
MEGIAQERMPRGKWIRSLGRVRAEVFVWSQTMKSRGEVQRSPVLRRLLAERALELHQVGDLIIDLELELESLGRSRVREQRSVALPEPQLPAKAQP